MQLEQPQAIRTVFFDAGFTLLHPYPSNAEICRQVCQRLNLHIHLAEVEKRLSDAEEFRLRQTGRNRHLWASEKAINELWIDYYMKLLRPFVEEHDESRLYQLARMITEEFAEHTSWQVYPDVIPTLEALHAQHYTLGVISDWGIRLSTILRRLHLLKYFDCVVVSSITHHAKPSPALYETALMRANAIADYTLHIGDSYILDVLGARAVGMTPVLLDRQQSLEQDNVDCPLVHSLSGLLDLLEVVG